MKTFIAAACHPEKYYSQKPTFLRRGLNGLTVCSFVNRQSWQQPQKRRWNPVTGGGYFNHLTRPDVAALMCN